MTLVIDVVGGSDEKNEPMEDRRKDGEGERRREGGKRKKCRGIKVERRKMR